MIVIKKNILRILFALSIFANINVYSAYNPCIDRPQYLTPQFLLPKFSDPDFEKVKFEKQIIETNNIVWDDYVKPDYIKPSFVLPRFQDCFAMQERKTAHEKVLIEVQQKPTLGATNQNEKFVVNTAKESIKTSESNPNSFFFYKPPEAKSENTKEDCCGVVGEKDIKDEGSQVVTSRRISDLR